MNKTEQLVLLFKEWKTRHLDEDSESLKKTISGNNISKDFLKLMAFHFMNNRKIN